MNGDDRPVVLLDLLLLERHGGNQGNVETGFDAHCRLAVNASVLSGYNLRPYSAERQYLARISALHMHNDLSANASDCSLAALVAVCGFSATALTTSRWQFGRELRERCRRRDSDRTALDGLDQLEIQARLLTGEASPYIGFKTR